MRSSDSMRAAVKPILFAMISPDVKIQAALLVRKNRKDKSLAELPNCAESFAAATTMFAIPFFPVTLDWGSCWERSWAAAGLRAAPETASTTPRSGIFPIPVAPAAVVEVRYYEIQSGDTLSAIAKKSYGNASEYPRIFETNREVIKDANLIYPGQKIRIPMG